MSKVIDTASLRSIAELAQVNLAAQRVIMRVDYNVPLTGGEIADDTRIQVTIAGIKEILPKVKQLVLLSHLGRPNGTGYQEEYSLQPVRVRLQEFLSESIELCADIPSCIAATAKILLLENIRFFPGETTNSAEFVADLCNLGDSYIFDAFATAHRQHASTFGLAKKFGSRAVCGPLVISEITALAKVATSTVPNSLAVIGGAKISTKLPLLQALAKKVKTVIIGGGMANTLLLAQGYEVGISLVEQDMLQEAKDFLTVAANLGVEVILPSDVVTKDTSVKQIDSLQDSDCILDIGVATANNFAAAIVNAQLIVWNGPMGLFEEPSFRQGTKIVAEAIANSQAYSLAGGGDTIAAIKLFGITEQISYVSTGGGAFLDYLQAGTLPVLEVLTKN